MASSRSSRIHLVCQRHEQSPCSMHLKRMTAGLHLIALAAVLAAAKPAIGDSLYFALPEQFNEKDVEYIARWVRLSDAQKHAFAAMMVLHTAQHQETFAARISDIQRLANEGASHLMSGFSAESDRAYRRFIQEQRRYIEAMAAVDAAVLVDLASILAEAQQPLQHHIELWRQRRRCLMLGWNLRSAGTDLELLALHTFQKNPAVLDDARDQLSAYAQAVTARYVQCDKASLEKTLDDVRIMADPAIPLEQKSAAKKIAFAAAAAREIELARLNAAHLEVICTALPTPYADQLKRSYQETVYPLTYPDLPVSEGYTRAFLASKELTPEQHADIELRWAQQSADLGRNTDEMARREQAWNEHVARNSTFDGADEFSSFMRERRLQRWLLHQKYLEGLLASYETIISPDQTTAILATINDINVLIHRGKNDHYPMR